MDSNPLVRYIDVGYIDDFNPLDFIEPKGQTDLLHL